ncbi:MAG: lipid-binding SYLF domain-containing protein [Deltaproteobacteria bacterium]
MACMRLVITKNGTDLAALFLFLHILYVFCIFPGGVSAANTSRERVEEAITVIDELLRNPQTSHWEGPIFLTIGGGSFGWQIGITASDLVLVVMNPRGADAVMHENLGLGGDISVAAGPIGRQFKAGTDITIRSELLAYSRSRGIFAGISLEGTYIHQDYASNEAFYGSPYTLTEIMAGGATLPPEGKRLIDFLNTRVPAGPSHFGPSGSSHTQRPDS